MNLGESLSPVLIAKIQHGALHPQTVLERFTNPEDGSDEGSDEESIGPGLDSDFGSDFGEEDGDRGAWMGDVEWIAFEVFEEDDSDDEEDEEDDDPTEDLIPAMSSMQLNSSPTTPSTPPLPSGRFGQEQQASSLSLLEYVVRLAALQTFEQQSHMNLTDEHIVLFLRDDNPSSRQQPTIDQAQSRIPRRRSSIVSISSDFSGRAHPITAHLPISPPRSEEMDDKNNLGTTPSSTGANTPLPEKIPEQPAITRNPRSHLVRAMAADYDPMTLMTPPSNRRITRNGARKLQPIAFPRKKGAETQLESNSAPGTLQKVISGVGDGARSGSGGGSDTSPLAGKSGGAPISRRVVSTGTRK